MSLSLTRYLGYSLSLSLACTCLFSVSLSPVVSLTLCILLVATPKAQAARTANAATQPYRKLCLLHATLCAPTYASHLAVFFILQLRSERIERT